MLPTARQILSYEVAASARGYGLSFPPLLLTLCCLLALVGCGLKAKLCEECRMRRATVFVTTILAGKSTQQNVCEECAKKRGIL